MLAAARLLADAKVDVICWNGTSGAWKGLAADEAICAAIREETGIPATTGTLAQIEAFRAHGVSRYALAVPYLAEVRDAIVEVYGGAGFTCVNSAHLGISTNFAFAEIDLDTLRDLIRERTTRPPRRSWWSARTWRRREWWRSWSRSLASRSTTHWSSRSGTRSGCSAGTARSPAGAASSRELGVRPRH